ncbi:anaerobic C4-dicarboxylate transporter family protein [Actinosynnema sp. NPDC047251]|uniref:C4-dicarboxylate membrane transporter n=1 Tax=Saccharothrix espanaensis (strain ATCC 51144 / DSM 44229 / JCM 9112 / NBRC 15066 / NRRL 15764) TaxID=1179773 RepID=K0K2U6_SACES|nr:anaerobic C4-dicarboxylate transporter family protein [Saccharothrix espanaensis]CCH30898.1 C4-dicarboxylate membrane transporter [Saccharothrix espanaensis DSM 44229]
MDALIISLELLVVLGAIVMGTRSSGVALGLWGGLGVGVLVFVFREPAGTPPVDALLIVLAVVLAASMMQVAGGIDWMVRIAARVISRYPRQITLIAPLVTFLFSVGAGTSNILYPLLPVISDVAYRNGERPSRPLSLSVVATGVALACSPVSAAMAAMVTLTDVDPYRFELIDIVKVTLPAAVLGIVASFFVVRRLGKDVADDPEIQARVASGELPPASPGSTRGLPEATPTGRAAALVFLSGVLVIVVLGLFKDLRPEDARGAELGMTPIIEMVMFAVGTVILVIARPKVADVPMASVFRAGMVSAIALFGLAWLTDTFISAHQALVVDTVGRWVDAAPWIFALGVFLVCVATTSQSTATRTIVPIGLAAGLAPGMLAGMWGGAFAGIYVLPTNGSQIAAANFDQTGSTKLGSKLVDHSFFVPAVVLAVTTAVFGALIGLLIGG